VNAIFFYRRHHSEERAVAIHDVEGCIKTWGWRGTLSGALLGLALGAIFVANPFAAGVLTFGIAGTLIVCAIECAVVGGGFGIAIAAIHGQGVLRASKTELEQVLISRRLTAAVKWRRNNGSL
jgi:hypothetical protein